MENKSTSPVRIEPLQKRHDRARFDCGIEVLNRYLKELAKQELERKTAAVFVLVSENEPQILGYYTLSQSSVILSDLPESRRKKLPRYPQIPTTLLGRLAVDQSCKGKGYGELLLLDALKRAWSISQQVASFAMVVDVLEVEPDPLAFYVRYGFEPLPTQPRRLLLPLRTCDQLFAEETENKPEPSKKPRPAPVAPPELELSLKKIDELFFGMKLFDKDGGYMGRICELNREKPGITYLTPSQGTHTMALATAKESCKRGFLLQEVSDPAAQQRWKQASDVPASRPGLTFEDGVRLGRQQAKELAGHVPAPFDWLYKEPAPFTLGEDDFNNGYLSGFVPTFRDCLLAKFPPEDDPPQKVEDNQKGARWSFDPLDPASIISFHKGAEEAKNEPAWLPELAADRRIDELIEERIQSGSLVRATDFRCGFKDQMEKRFPHRY